MNEYDLDCILIPGGGLLEDNKLPDWTKARLHAALQIQHTSRWIGLLSGGTVHKPSPTDQNGYPVFESRRAAWYLIEHQVDPGKLLTEISSYDTIGNAYFSRLLFAEPFQLTRLHIITSDFHFERTKTIFEWIYSLAPRKFDYQLSFQSTPNQGLTGSALAARVKRERASLEALQRKIQAINTLDVFHHWIYSSHAAYTPGKEKEPLSKNELQSY